MKENRWFLLLRTFVIVILSVLVSSMAISALTPTAKTGQGYVVLASVQPTRYIVVDSNLQIKQVVSNTAQDVMPYVVLNGLDGHQIPYTTSIQNQFANLKSSLSFAKAGVVYQRNTSNSLSGAAKNALSTLRRFIFGS